MKLSAPIYALKRKAKLFARRTNIALHQALDKVALDEGYRSWSHLVSSSKDKNPAQDILLQLVPGDLCLIGARPGQGKTLLGLELAASASRLGRKGYVFTLCYHERDVADRFASMGIDPKSANKAIVLDTSDDICADYIISKLACECEPVLLVVDYLQLLDQKRTNPSLDHQMASLRDYMTKTGAMCVVISQIDRAFDLAGKAMPDISDVRLPNPLDVSIFSKFFFLHKGAIRFDQAA